MSCTNAQIPLIHYNNITYVPLQTFKNVTTEKIKIVKIVIVIAGLIFGIRLSGGKQHKCHT